MPPGNIAGVMGYLIEIDDLRSHIVFPKPGPDAPEVQEQTAAPAEVLKKDAPDCRQEELKLPLK
jgi:hypothetical protein